MLFAAAGARRVYLRYVQYTYSHDQASCLASPGCSTGGVYIGRPSSSVTSRSHSHAALYICVSSQAFSTLQPPQHPNDHLPRPYELSMIPARSTYDAHAHPCTLLVSYAPTNIMPILIRLSLTLRDGSTKLPYPAHYTQFLLTPPPPAARRLAACTASAARTHARSTTAWSWTAAPPPPPPPRHPRCYTSLPPLFSRAAAPPSAPAARRAAPPWRPWSAGPPRPVEGKCAPRRHNVGLKAWGLGTGFKV